MVVRRKGLSLRPVFFKKMEKSLSVFKNLTNIRTEKFLWKRWNVLHFLRMYWTAKRRNQNFFQPGQDESGKILIFFPKTGAKMRLAWQ